MSGQLKAEWPPTNWECRFARVGYRERQIETGKTEYTACPRLKADRWPPLRKQ
ncbi:hypothetical protein ACVWZW_004426 [Bradyrhizobium sp. F1.13.4]